MNLPENKQRALNEFVDRVTKLYGERIEEMVLFGSTARGSSGEESDIDVLVIARDVDLSDLVKIAHEVMLKHGEVIIPLLRRSDEYRRYSDYSLYRNIMKEGIILVRGGKRVQAR